MRPFVVAALLAMVAGCVQPEAERTLAWASPEPTAAGLLTVVEWEVRGEKGVVAHADVHAGPLSVKSPKAASYPAHYDSSNRSAPGYFQAVAVFPDEGTWFARPHVVVAGMTLWGKERTFDVEDGLAVRAHAPAFVRAGGPFELAFESSRPAANATVALLPAEAVSRPAFQVPAAAQAVGLGAAGNLTFEAPEPGWSTYRLRVVADDVTYWSAEFELTSVDLTVRLLDPPTEVPAGEPIRYAWRVEGTPVVLTTHTGIHFATQPWDRLNGNVTAEAMEHRGAQDAAAVPAEYAALHAFDEPGPRFLRAHLRLGSGDGALDFFSDLQELTVT